MAAKASFAYGTMRLVLLLSLLLLSATHQQRFANAAETPAAPVKATVKQFDDSYGEGESAYSPSDSKPEKQDYAIDDSLCPEPQPADAVKQGDRGRGLEGTDSSAQGAPHIHTHLAHTLLALKALCHILQNIWHL